MIENIMSMLQRYANNLEALVGERTSQLEVEKKKTETLLYEILPRFVALLHSLVTNNILSQTHRRSFC